MTRGALREPALAPLSRGDAERLLPGLSAKARLTTEELLLRGRCLRVVESFHSAWNELWSFREGQADALLRARAEIDLIYLAYYLVRADEVADFPKSVERAITGRPLLAADLHLALSVLHTGADRIADAFRDAQFAQDALRVAPPGRERDLVLSAVQRQLAHLLGYATSYDDATRAAREAMRAAERTADSHEAHWSTYAGGYVDWLAGRIESARDALERAERALRESGSSLWRWTLFCLACVEAELGVPKRGERLAEQSGYGTPDGLAYLALRRGDPAVAEEIIDSAPDSPLAAPTRAVLGLIRCQRGDERMGIRLLDEARVAFHSHGLLHYALACDIHAGYWREQLARGSGAGRALRALEEIAAGGGEGFHWYDPLAARWLGAIGAKNVSTRPVAARMSERARRVLAERGPEAPVEVGLDSAVPFLRSRGLTAREIDVLRAMEEMATGGGADRDGLARRLRMSPNTLRVHLTRIRSKLDVGPRRGDEAILAAALRRG